MSNQAVDPLLFWLEQEPADSSDSQQIYLPADTPNNYALNKFNYQLDKKRNMKRFRAIERLKAYELALIKNRRKQQPPDDAQREQTRPFAALQVIQGEDFLNSHVHEIVEVLKIAQDAQQDQDTSMQEADKIYDSDIRFEERDYNQVKSLFTQNTIIVDEYEKEFARIRNDIYNETRDQSHHPPLSSAIQTSDVPPLPQGMSSRDPRTFLPEFRKLH